MCVPPKPHPLGNGYHSIADVDKDGTKPIMWWVNLVAEKDQPKVDGQYIYAPQFKKKGISPTVALLLEMTEPIHGTGKVVTGNSGFCVTQGILDLHAIGVFGEFLIKKQRYWPKGVPGDYIDQHMSGKKLGATETFVKVLNGIQFYIHCTWDCDYVTKNISLHGVLDEIQDHPIWQLVDRTWKTFKYAEPFSHHNHAKHWVDNVLEEIWAKNGGQIINLHSYCSEANALQAWAHGKKKGAELTLNFWKQLAKCMIFNKLGDNGVAPTSPTNMSRKGSWLGRESFNTVKTPYLCEKCSNCTQTTREYCTCAPLHPLCRGCFVLHLEEHGGWNTITTK